MSELFSHVLEAGDEGRKLEHILRTRFHFSQKLLRQLKDGERVWLDGRFVYLNTCGLAGQRLTVDIANRETGLLTPEDLPVSVLYEDDCYLAVNKPAGQIVHPNAKYPAGSLGNAVAHYWRRKGEDRVFRPTSRLDRDTSGIVLIALNRYAQQQLGWRSKQGTTEKLYLGLVSGVPSPETGLWDQPLGFHPGGGTRRAVRADGQEARTGFRLRASYGNYSLVEFTLLTGRTHQIRAHAAAAGHPLLGDDMYGGSREFMPRQALHAFSYRFPHPLTGRPVHVTAPLPDDMAALVPSDRRFVCPQVKKSSLGCPP
ncbi:MAG: RluA family pseudouridine synthase [Gracilibacteraceae bacterium]|jgi:23S rRNA pseudouridine1911/1915/1917 synthase|nr:RluA family pseudouridine synthase [Gracilibacteraceae bacterium]